MSWTDCENPWICWCWAWMLQFFCSVILPQRDSLLSLRALCSRWSLFLHGHLRARLQVLLSSIADLILSWDALNASLPLCRNVTASLLLCLPRRMPAAMASFIICPLGDKNRLGLATVLPRPQLCHLCARRLHCGPCISPLDATQSQLCPRASQQFPEAGLGEEL